MAQFLISAFFIDGFALRGTLRKIASLLGGAKIWPGGVDVSRKRQAAQSPAGLHVLVYLMLKRLWIDGI